MPGSCCRCGKLHVTLSCPAPLQHPCSASRILHARALTHRCAPAQLLQQVRLEAGLGTQRYSLNEASCCSLDCSSTQQPAGGCTSGTSVAAVTACVRPGGSLPAGGCTPDQDRQQRPVRTIVRAHAYVLAARSWQHSTAQLAALWSRMIGSIVWWWADCCWLTC